MAASHGIRPCRRGNGRLLSDVAKQGGLLQNPLEILRDVAKHGGLLHRGGASNTTDNSEVSVVSFRAMS